MSYLSQLTLAHCTLNIPHTEAFAAINKLIEDTETDTLLKMFISNLTHQVLTKNYFKFNENYMNKFEELQWELEWHPTMPLYSCTI